MLAQGGKGPLGLRRGRSDDEEYKSETWTSVYLLASYMHSFVCLSVNIMDLLPLETFSRRLAPVMKAQCFMKTSNPMHPSVCPSVAWFHLPISSIFYTQYD
jgi:hypothetical protein